MTSEDVFIVIQFGKHRVCLYHLITTPFTPHSVESQVVATTKQVRIYYLFIADPK